MNQEVHRVVCSWCRYTIDRSGRCIRRMPDDEYEQRFSDRRMSVEDEPLEYVTGICRVCAVQQVENPPVKVEIRVCSRCETPRHSDQYPSGRGVCKQCLAAEQRRVHRARVHARGYRWRPV